VITKIEAFSAQFNAPQLSMGTAGPGAASLLSAQTDAIQIRGVEGIGPVKADVTSTPFATRGALIQGTSVGARNIVLKLGLSPDWVDQTVASLRQLLYRYFLPEAWTKLRFTSDELPPVDIEGTVESCDPNIFSEDPEMIVSILCPRPDFVDPEAVIMTGEVSDGPNPANRVEFEYIGSVKTGFELKVELAEGNPSFTGAFDLGLWQDPDVDSEGRLRVNPAVIDADQYLHINTIPGSKRVEHIGFGGQETTALGAMYFQWVEIQPGTNTLIIYSDDDPVGLHWTLAYFNRFAGF
jgi:hypothetical protein